MISCDPKEILKAASCFCFPRKVLKAIHIYLLCQIKKKVEPEGCGEQTNKVRLAGYVGAFGINQDYEWDAFNPEGAAFYGTTDNLYRLSTIDIATGAIEIIVVGSWRPVFHATFYPCTFYKEDGDYGDPTDTPPTGQYI